jgi:hypothetical protein
MSKNQQIKIRFAALKRQRGAKSRKKEPAQWKDPFLTIDSRAFRSPKGKTNSRDIDAILYGQNPGFAG